MILSELVKNSNSWDFFSKIFNKLSFLNSLESLEDAQKMMSFARRRMRRFSVIHVASAQLELKKGGPINLIFIFFI